MDDHKITGIDQGVWLCFQGFRMPFLPQYHYWMDGRPGRRCLFVSNEDRSFVLSFEEGMKCLDLVEARHEEGSFLCFESRRGEVYLHERRTKARPIGGNYAFFHFEIPDVHGTVRFLSGQINVRQEYCWTHGPEPILLDLLEGITLAEHSEEKE